MKAAPLVLRQWYQHHQSYGAEVNSHDLVKALAVVIMICDHIGFYLFPEDMWWRAIGRIGFPVWFFMAGYATRGGYVWSLLPGMLVLVFTRYVLGFDVLAINALLTIFIIRAMILYIPPQLERKHWPLTPVIALLAILLLPPTSALFEYGSIGLLFGYLGYMCRNNADSPHLRLLAISCYLAFMVTQLYPPRFNDLQTLVIMAGTAFFMHWLYFFRNKKYAGSESWYGLGPVIRGLGRHTLLVYVVHLCLLALINAALRT